MANDTTGKEGKDGKASKKRASNAAKAPPAPAVTGVAMPHHRIPRPPNAFMIFANEHRKILAKKHPRESNKEISIRLGKMWRGLADDVKAKYHAHAKVLDLEHKKKYPDYVYNPRDARLRKEARRQRLIAGQHLARAMTHHIMVKQAKNNMLNLAPPRMPVAVPCMKNGPDIHEQMNNARRAAIRDQVLRGLGLENPGDKRTMGYLIGPNNQPQSLPGFQTFMTSPSMPIHLLPPRHPPPTATITSPASNFGSNQNYPPNSGSFAPTSTVTACQTMSSASQVSTFANHATSKYNEDRPREAVTVQFVHPSSQESIPKNPLLTLADEAVSKLSETNTEMKGVGRDGERGGDEAVNLEESEENVLVQEMEDGEGNGNKNEYGEQVEQKLSMNQQNLLEMLGNREKMMQKGPMMTTWLAKPENSVRINRPMPLYFVHPPATPPLMTVRPPVAACIQYTSNSSQVFQANSTGGTAIQRMTENQTAISGSPRNGISMQHALWDNVDTNMFSGGSTIPTYSNNYGGHVFYVPMQELAYTSTYPYANACPTYQQCFQKTRESTITKASDADQMTIPNLTFTVTEDSSAGGEEMSSTGKNFGQILSSTMQILTEEQVEQDGKSLDPTCHVNYELVEKEASPNRHLAELTSAQAVGQFTTVYY